jgi:hypothetical protein
MSSSYSHKQLFELAVYISYAVYATTIIGISFLAPNYVEMVRTFIHAYVACFLLWRFRPPFLGGAETGMFGAFDRKIAFHAGMAMLLSLTILRDHEMAMAHSVGSLIGKL